MEAGFRSILRRCARAASAWLAAPLVAAPLVAQEPAQVVGDHASGFARIDAEDIDLHVRYLASPLLEGRDTPSRGLDLAAAYIARRFRAVGLQPAGDSLER
ncbi:MAG: hypothetical protein RL112_1845, partial [Planctomycetota bacterium]